MNLQEMRTELGFLLNFNENEADQDFTVAQLNRALNYVYNQQVEAAKQEGMSHWFKKIQSFTWNAGAITQLLPSGIAQANVLGFWDITSSNPGTKIQVRENPLDSCDAWWLEYNVLQWGSAGPPQTKTIQVHYLANAEELLGDLDVPTLVAPQFHWLLVWGAAVYLRRLADEEAPPSWMEEQTSWQFRYWKFLTRGRPLSDTPAISNSFVNNDVGILY